MLGFGSFICSLKFPQTPNLDSQTLQFLPLTVVSVRFNEKSSDFYKNTEVKHEPEWLKDKTFPAYDLTNELGRMFPFLAWDLGLGLHRS